MFLNKNYDKSLKLALEIDAELPENVRTSNYFPRLWVAHKPNPDYDPNVVRRWDAPYIPITIPDLTKPQTKGAAEQWFQASRFCCGLFELTLMWNQVMFWTQTGTKLAASLSIEQKRRANLAFVLNQLSPPIDDARVNTESPQAMKGFMFWCGRPERESHGDLLSFGFTKIVDFVNPVHGYSHVEMLGCSTPIATSRMQKEGRIKEWPVGSTMRAA